MSVCHATNFKVDTQLREAAQNLPHIHASSCTEAVKRRARTFAYGVAVPLCSLLVAILVQHHLLLDSIDKGFTITRNGKHPVDVHLEIALLQTCVLSTLVTGVSAGALLLVAEFLPGDNYGASRCHYLALKLLLHACGFLLELTAFCLLLLIDAEGNAAMALFVLLAAALHVILFNNTRQSNYRSDATGYAPHAEELDHLIDFAKEMVSVAYGGLIGRVFDYFKYFTTDVRRTHLKFFDVLMFFTAVVGALALTLDALPPLLREEQERNRLVRGLEWLNIVSALIAMTSALTLSFGAVGEYAFLAVVPPLALAVWWLNSYFANEGPRRRAETGGREAQPAGHGAPVPLTVSSMAFAELLAVVLNSNGEGGGSGGHNNTPPITGPGAVVDLAKVSICVFAVVFTVGLGLRLLEHRLLREPNLASAAARYMSRCYHTMIVAAMLLLGALGCQTIWNFATDGKEAGPDGRSISPTPALNPIHQR